MIITKKIKSRNSTFVELRLFILYHRESYEGKLGSNADSLRTFSR